MTDMPTNVEIYKASTDAAGLCKEIVVATAMNIQKRKYVRVEGWQAIATAHGCVASSRDVEEVENGVRAIGEVRRMLDGQLISQAEGFVGKDETTWFGGEIEYEDQEGRRRTRKMPKRADYAIRAMAQTRAISRACRSAFAYVVVMMNAGLQTTPAEEVGGEEQEHIAKEDRGEVIPPQQPAPAPAETKKPDPNRARIDQFLKGFKERCMAAQTSDDCDAILKDGAIMQGADWLNRHSKPDWQEFCRLRDAMTLRFFGGSGMVSDPLVP